MLPYIANVGYNGPPVAWRALALFVVLHGAAHAAENQCAALNAEVVTRVLPWRTKVESLDQGRHSGSSVRCGALAGMSDDLQDIRSELDDLGIHRGRDVSCDTLRAALDGNAEWAGQHAQALGCNPTR